MREADKIIMGIDPGTNVMGYGIISVTQGKAKAEALGVIDMQRQRDPYLRLGHIYERVTSLIATFLPDEMAIEAPFFGKNFQSVLKLGRAQGVAIAAAIERQIPIREYAPMKIKMALTGNGSASKEQVAGMLQRILNLKKEELPKFMDATDALAAAYCHYLQSNVPAAAGEHFKSWKDFALRNKARVSGNLHAVAPPRKDK
ncbi:MAG: crossover junction endodeoxyribonuclease RuvC [Prevotella sp.]|nr:crossover junction endodeoxyribonuclease RuvC [Prevotella sp.]